MTPEKKERPSKKARSRDEIVRRRVLLLAVTAVVLLVFAIWLKLWIRQPEIPLPSETPADDSEYVSIPGRRDGVFTFLILGRDTGGGGNTDTMMVATYDTVNQSVNVMNIYRDTMVNAPWDIKRINSVYNYGGGGEKGITLLKEYLQALLGFSPDYYITVEWDAVGQLVDAIGGVEFDVPYEMHYWDPTQNLRIDQAKGLRTLTGDDAMQVIRWRKNNDGSGISVGDIGRVKVQQDFLKAVVKQCLSTVSISTLPKYAQILLDNVTTDLPIGNIVWLGQKALGLDLDALVFHSLPGNLNGSAWSRTVGNYQSYVLPDGEKIVELVNEYFNPYEEDIKLSDLDIMSVNADGSLSSSQGVVKDTKAASAPVKPSAAPEPSAEPLPSEEPLPTEDPILPEEPDTTAEPTQEPESDVPLPTEEPSEPDAPASEAPSPSEDLPSVPPDTAEDTPSDVSEPPADEIIQTLPTMPAAA